MKNVASRQHCRFVGGAVGLKETIINFTNHGKYFKASLIMCKALSNYLKQTAIVVIVKLSPITDCTNIYC